MIEFHKKANTVAVVVDTIIILLLAAIAVVVIIHIKGQSAVVDLTCGNNFVGKGDCKSSCDSSEQGFRNAFGCPTKNDPSKDWCCISLENTQPIANFGGDDSYNFRMTYIDVMNPDQQHCTKQTDAWIYTCPAGTVKLKIGAENLGTKDLQLSTNPKVNLDNQDTWPFGQPVLVSAKKTAELYIDISIKAGAQYKINPAAKCLSDECKSKFGPNGIFRINMENQITIIGK